MMSQTREKDSWESRWWCHKPETLTHGSHDDDATNQRHWLMGVMMMMPQTRDMDSWESWWWCLKQETRTHESHDDNATNKRQGLMRAMMMMPQTRDMDSWDPWWWCHKEDTWTHENHNDDATNKIHELKQRLTSLHTTCREAQNVFRLLFWEHKSGKNHYGWYAIYILFQKKNVQCFWIN